MHSGALAPISKALSPRGHQLGEHLDPMASCLTNRNTNQSEDNGSLLFCCRSLVLAFLLIHSDRQLHASA
jgi:hypothetical protein